MTPFPEPYVFDAHCSSFPIMPDNSAKLRPDVAETAFRVMQEAVGDAPKMLPPGQRIEKNPEAVKRGAAGGKKGGKRGGEERAMELTKRRRVSIARKAAKKRWRKPDSR